MAWRRDETLYQELHKPAKGRALLVQIFVLGRYSAGKTDACPEGGESFLGFPPPPEGVAFLACESVGIEALEERRAVRDWCAELYKLAVARWLGHRTRCYQAGWRCGNMEVAEALDKLGGVLPAAGFARDAAVGANAAPADSVAGVALGAALGLALGRILKH